ncbi:hypothetical protein ETH_00035955 [Eimeria tenella]|uniref:Uncharacterized protein n=1 Tax=Eimeria tenella TaxID=5802 RepID=U6L1H0_EIMTE|nr:hypothetical protein ETH_00035955 [Eimeria tenella]CDJ44262.1 hypothetical protein ETH_00035955 [Eimeria tenella]|eukprot:XP_013235011.1 hypothetical protein ETH_00035955 [Eimeria tenella]
MVAAAAAWQLVVRGGISPATRAAAAAAAGCGPTLTLCCLQPTQQPSCRHYSSSLGSREGPLGQAAATHRAAAEDPAAANPAAAAAAAARLPSAQLVGLDFLPSAIPQLPAQLLAAAARRLLLQGIEDSEAWQLLGARAAETAQQLSLQHCAAVLKCFAARRYRDFCCFNAVTSRLTDIVAAEGVAALGTEEAVSILCAFAALQFVDR